MVQVDIPLGKDNGHIWYPRHYLKTSVAVREQIGVTTIDLIVPLSRRVRKTLCYY